MGEKFIRFIDECLPQLNYKDRSSFIRDAIAEKLTRDGYRVPGGMATAPYRAGKVKQYPAHRHHPFLLNEQESNSEATAVGKVLARRGAAEARRGRPGPPPSPEAGAPNAQTSRQGRGSGKRSNRPPLPGDKAPTEQPGAKKV